MRRLCATAAAFYITKVLPQLSPPLASQHRVTPARDRGNSKRIQAAIVSEHPATPLSGRGGANTGRRMEGGRAAPGRAPFEKSLGGGGGTSMRLCRGTAVAAVAAANPFNHH